MKNSKKKILIIDDDEKHIMATKEILENEGFEVHFHLNSFGATNSTIEIKPDLILLDINMPALSGDNLSKLLSTNEKTKHIPIVFYSSNDEDTLRKLVLEHKVKGYICKGNISELKRKIFSYLCK